MEKLRDALPGDDPARVDLTLRLADLYFDVSIKDGKEVDQFNDYRNKALNLYQISLKILEQDKKNTSSHFLETKQINIQFQMARLLTKLQKGHEAEKLYLEVYKNLSTNKKIQEQSALALAEWFDEQADFSQAKNFYEQTLFFTEDGHVTNYIYYRLAWLYYKETQLAMAIDTMIKSLWLPDGQLRENSVTDLILFYSQKEDGEMEAFNSIKSIAIKSKRPELPRQLVEAFYISGNRKAGSILLAELNKDYPNLYYEARLLEEFYGFREWDKVELVLKGIEEKKSLQYLSILKAEEQKEVQSTLRRFVIQIDAERITDKKLNHLLKRSIDVYLTFYPEDELKSKMRQGWIASEEDDENKLNRLTQWIESDKNISVDEKQLVELRQQRLALASKLNRSEVIVIDALALAKIANNDLVKQEEFNYLAARAYYELKNYSQALELFNKILNFSDLASSISQKKIQAQNLMLDIYNQEKKYDSIITQINNWKNWIKTLPGKNLSKELLKENQSIDKILVESKFAKALSVGASNEGLETFFQFCLEDIIAEKSCENAKVLAIQLKNQEKLVQLLEKLNDQAALLIEYERMGKFSVVATMLEKNSLKTSLDYSQYLKMALFFELDGDFAGRDRVLLKMTSQLNREKSMPVELEDAIFLTLLESKLIETKTLFLPWSTNNKIKIATILESVKSSEVTSKLLLAQKSSQGSIWSTLVLRELQKELKGVDAIKFYGHKSKSLFQKRTKALEAFSGNAKPYLEGADLETRIYILHMLKLAYKNVANEILNTPVPEGLDEATMTEVATKISQLAEPFDIAHENYEKLLSVQLSEIKDQEQSNKMADNLSKVENDQIAYHSLIENKKLEQSLLSTKENLEISQLKKQLAHDPDDDQVLKKLKHAYSAANNARAAAYFAGRLANESQGKV
jgi:tetratricopeptide (TPR) repeat protein